MTYVITDACIDVKDESCIEVCPVDCIHTSDDDRMCYVDPVECIDCAVCESACPVGAIFIDSAVPSDAAEFTAINVNWFHDKASARERVDAIAEAGGSIT